MIIHNYTFSPDRGRLRMRVRWHKFSVSISIPIKIDTNKWNYDMQRCARNSSHYGISSSELNNMIDDYQRMSDDIFREAAAAGQQPMTSDEFKHRMNVKLGKVEESDNRGDFQKHWRDFVAERSSIQSWSYNTTKITHNTYKHIVNLFPNLSVSQINEKFIADFVSKMSQLGHRNTSIRSHISRIKYFVSWCEKKQIITEHISNTISVNMKGAGRKSNAIVYLTWDEVMKLMNTEQPTLIRNAIRDIFCFCCFTGLRYSDVSRLRWSDVQDDCIKVVTMKTTNALTIQLNKYSREILDRHRQEHNDNNLVFHFFNANRIDYLIKKISKSVGIDEPITKTHYIGNERIDVTKPKWKYISSHCGRRTFVVNALRLGIPPQVVMSWTGHSNFEAMKPYIAIVEEHQKESMSLFDKE